MPFIVKNGAPWFRGWGTEKSPGTKIFSVSGPVNRPGNYEIEMGLPLRALIDDYAGGMKSGREAQGRDPRRISVPWLTPDQLDSTLDFDSVAAAGSLWDRPRRHLPRRAACAWCMPRSTSPALLSPRIVRASARRVARARTGLERYWPRSSTGRAVDDGARSRPCLEQILGRSLCALGDAAAMPILSVLEKFPPEIEHHLTAKRRLVNRRRASVEARVRSGEPATV